MFEMYPELAKRLMSATTIKEIDDLTDAAVKLGLAVPRKTMRIDEHGVWHPELPAVKGATK